MQTALCRPGFSRNKGSWPPRGRAPPTWVAERHGVVDELAGLEQDGDLLLGGVGLVHAGQLLQDLLQDGHLGHTGGHAQIGGGSGQDHLLVHLELLQGAILAVDLVQARVDGFLQGLQDALVQG